MYFIFDIYLCFLLKDIIFYGHFLYLFIIGQILLFLLIIQILSRLFYFLLIKVVYDLWVAICRNFFVASMTLVTVMLDNFINLPFL